MGSAIPGVRGGHGRQGAVLLVDAVEGHSGRRVLLIVAGLIVDAIIILAIAVSPYIVIDGVVHHINFHGRYQRIIARSWCI